MKVILNGLVLICFILLLSMPYIHASASENEAIQLPFTSSAVIIDGDLSDSAWTDARKLQLAYETKPRENVNAELKTEVYIMEDGRNFYIAFKAYDPDPTEISANYRERDNIWDDDTIAITIDTFNDQRRAFQFLSNPLGVQSDGIFDQVNHSNDYSWNAVWESAGKITDFGYVVEIAIPLDILRFPDNLDVQTWGIDLGRIQPRSVRTRVALNPDIRGASCFLCNFIKIKGFRDIKPSRNLEVVPAITAQRFDERDVANNQDWQQGELDDQASLDIRWGVNADTTLNATINPDFSQVEADALQLDINRTFSLYFPEKRPFFLASADYFNTLENIVHTRNIGAPDFGFKFTNKTEDRTIGVFTADDEATNFLIPGNEGSELATYDESSSNTAVRYRHNIGEEDSLGMIYTNRTANDYQNNVIGIDGKNKLGEHDTFNYQFLYTNSQNPALIQTDFDLARNQTGRAAIAEYSHRNRDWNLNVFHQEFSQDFRADLGFINMVDFKYSSISSGYNWYGNGNHSWTEMGINSSFNFTRKLNGDLLNKSMRLSYYISGAMQSHISSNVFVSEQSYNNRLYDTQRFSFHSRVKPSPGLILMLNGGLGDQIDFSNERLGKQKSITPHINWYITRHLQIDGGYTHSSLDVDGGRLYTAKVAHFHFNYHFSIKSFMRIIFQGSDVTRDPLLYINAVDRKSKFSSSQLLYSYKRNPRTVFYVGYSDSGYADDIVDQLSRTDKTFFIKLSYALNL